MSPFLNRLLPPVGDGLQESPPDSPDSGEGSAVASLVGPAIGSDPDEPLEGRPESRCSRSSRLSAISSSLSVASWSESNPKSMKKEPVAMFNFDDGTLISLEQPAHLLLSRSAL